MEDFVEYIERLEEVEEEEDDDLQAERRRLRKRYVRDRTDPFIRFTDEEFRRRFRFRKEIVRDVIEPLINDKLRKENNRGLPIHPMLQVLLTLRFYATGNFQMVTADLGDISQPTVSCSVKRVSIAFAEKLKNYIKLPNTIEAQQDVMQQFYERGHFPNVQACVDCTHIRIRNPGGDIGEAFRNRKGWFSLNVQVAVDHQMKMVALDVRYPGSTHDNTIFDRSSLRISFENRLVQGLLLGDNGYACKRYLLTPVLNPQTAREKRYNSAHILTRNIVERTFGIWKRRFPCLHKELQTKLNTTMAIICATGVLYNISRSVDADDTDDGDNNNDDDENNDADEPHARFADGLAYRRAFIIRHFS